MDTILIDLFDTLVHPPSRTRIDTYLRSREISPDHPAFGLCFDGWPLGPLAAMVEGALPAIRDAMLLNRFEDVEDVAAHLSAEFGGKIAKGFLSLAEDFHGFFVGACVWDEDGIAALRRAGDLGLKRVLVTNVDALTLHRLLSELGETMFEGIAASCYCGFSKPASAIFDRAANGVGAIPESCSMIGDSWQSDVLGALDWGARAVWLDRGQNKMARLVLEAGPQRMLELGRHSPHQWSAALAPWLPARPSEWSADRWADTVRGSSSTGEAVQSAQRAWR